MDVSGDRSCRFQKSCKEFFYKDDVQRFRIDLNNLAAQKTTPPVADISDTGFK